MFNVVYTADTQQLNYQVILEDINGTYVKTQVAPTELATGPSDSAIPNEAKQKWEIYLNKTYKTISDQGQTYHIVLDNHANSKLKVTTRSLPQAFDHNSSVDQLVTIYLAPAPTAYPAKQQAAVNYQVVLENEQGQPVHTVVESKELGKGEANTKLSQETLDKWAGLVDHWKNQTVNYLGIDYKFAKIDEIPANATYDKHTYTIYLAPVAADIYYQVKL